jgi:hypothetical protein
MSMMTAHYIDTLAKDHWQQAREANQYNSALAQQPQAIRRLENNPSSLMSRFSTLLCRLHLVPRTQS